MKLSDLQNNEQGIITKVKGRGAFRKRIIEMGFIKGQKVTVIKKAPLRDPIEYNIMGLMEIPRYLFFFFLTKTRIHPLN